MVFPNINLLAVLAASILSMIIGYAWYSEVFLGPLWRKLKGHKKDALPSSMTTVILTQFAATIIQASVLAALFKIQKITSLQDALIFSSFVWFGFTAITQLTSALYDTKKFNLHLLMIEVGYQLVSITVMGAILASW